MRLILPAIVCGLCIGALVRLRSIQAELDQIKERPATQPATATPKPVQFRLHRSEMDYSVPWSAPATDHFTI